MKKIAMIGVGKLGQDCAEVMHDAGYDVIGYDIEPRKPKFRMCDSIIEVVDNRDIIFIAAPTPHDPIYGGETPTSHLPNKDFDYTIVKNILQEVNQYVNKNQLVVLISTVLPGTVRNQLEPLISNARFIYNPYLIAMGTIKWDMVNPEMVIIGTEDGSITGDAKELIDFYKTFMQNDPRYEVGTWDEAESIKIFYNTFISTKLSLVNMIQDVAEVNGNINVDVVTNALKKSTYRIMGPAYMTAALGDAGACHPRDNIALRWLAERLDLGYDLFDSIMTAREVQAEKMALRCLKNGKNVTIIGKAYKPGVPYTNGSASMLVGYYIEKHGGNLNYYDPNTDDNDLRNDWTQVYLIGYWEEWVEKLVFNDPGVVVIDPWRKITPMQHTGEIIHYGDSRRKHRYSVHKSTINTMRIQLFEIFPDLKSNENNIHLIDATINMDTTFVLRPTEDIVTEIIDAKNSGKNKFIFFACTEAFMPHVLSKIQRLATLLDNIVEDKDLIFLTTVPDGEEVYEKLKDKHIWNKTITIINCNFFNYVTTTYARDYEYIGKYEVRGKNKLFTCFNKLNREHRMVLINKMLERNLINKSYYSFEGDEYFVDNIDKLSDKFIHIKNNKDKFPLKLNITPERHNPVDIRPDDLIYYKDSYFSIITETLFYNKNYSNQHHRPFVEDSMFLTEKVYRCFALLHPFILFARPHSLKHLRSLGFKTFAPFINEEYDNIIDDDQRFEAIFNEIIRLTSTNNEDWETWQQGIKEIVEYNKDLFHQNKNFAFTQDYMKYFDNNFVHKIEDNREKFIQRHFAGGFNEIDTFENTVIVATDNKDTPEVITEIEDKKPININTNTNNLDWRNSTLTFNNGLVINFPIHIDGNGYILKDEIYDLIEKTGKEKYNKTLDWCSGHGPFGFDLLDRNKTDNVVFMDSYSIAVETCLTNAKENNLGTRVSGYIGDKISVIPQNEKFDLVVGNPPHCISAEHIQKNSSYHNTVRMIVDVDFIAHQEFFSNIKNYLTDDADIYITAGSPMNNFIQWATKGGLIFKGFAPSLVTEGGGIYHFKVKS